MALQLTAAPQISGQTATAFTSYCYLYEPLKVTITEGTGIVPTKYYIELEVRSTSDYATIVESISQYAVFDVNAGEGLTVDLMKIARQYHDANIYKFANIDDVAGSDGWKSVVSEYIYNFNITSDASATVDVVSKLPIIGGRPFDEFVATVSETQDLTEAEIQGINFTNMWSGWPYVIQTLADPTDNDARPTMLKVLGGIGTIEDAYSQARTPCGGYLVWKSKYGGWMQWGFDIGTESTSRAYQGNLQVGSFESTSLNNGDPYVQANYTGVQSSKTRTMKALNLTQDELRAASGILDSPAVYYVKSETGEMELVRLTSASAPLISSANGGVFSVSIKSISQLKQQTR
jgi:hypothetical protein